MNTIVLATDGSPAALEATREAIRLAAETEARLVIMGVEHVAVPAYGYYGYGEVYMDLLAGEHEHVQRVLADAAHQAEEAGVPTQTIAATGPVVESICDVARDKEARLIVVGAHGWNAIRRFVFGSVSTGVLHEAPCPVLVVRQSTATSQLDHVHADATAV